MFEFFTSIWPFCTWFSSRYLWPFNIYFCIMFFLPKLIKSQIGALRIRSEVKIKPTLQSKEIRVKIVKILISDAYIIRRQIEFLYSLNLFEVDTAKIERRSSNSTAFEFFNDALIAWHSVNGRDATVCKLCEILKSNGFRSVAEKLETEFQSESSSTSTRRIDIDKEPVSFEVNAVVRHFTGRTKELKRLEELFLGNQVYVATITGMGGIGKSELAKQFANNIHKKHNITIIWFNGQNRETLQDSVNRLAQMLQTSPDGSASSNLTDSFLQSANTMESKMKKRKLMIIDNVDEANQGAESLIKNKILHKDCFFLITSRNLKVLELAGEIIKLEIFSVADAQRFVSLSVEGETMEDVNRLCELVENFPLALQQAVAYIREQKLLSLKGKFYRIPDYIDSFATIEKKLLGYKLNFDHDYELTTLITWKVTIEKIQKDAEVGELAIRVLSLIAYFEPDRIHMDLIKLFFKDLDVHDIEKAIVLIKTYSLIKVENELVSIHRLLQQVIQLNTADQSLEAKQLREITNSMARILEDVEIEIQTIQPKFMFGNCRKTVDKYNYLNDRLRFRGVKAIIDNDLNDRPRFRRKKAIIDIIDNDLNDRLRFRGEKAIIDIIDNDFEYFKKVFDTNPLWNCIRSGIRHILSVWNHNCKHPELITEHKGLPIKIINITYPLRRVRKTIDDVTYFTNTNYSLFKTTFGANAEESLELESEVAFASEPKMSEMKMNKLDEIYKRQSSILGEYNLLNLKLLEKVSYSIICEGCYSSNTTRYGKYFGDFLRLREKISGRGHESTFPVRWQLMGALEAKDPELEIRLNELVNDVPPHDKEHFLENIKEYGESLYDDKNKWRKSNYMLELWLGFKGTEERWEVTLAKCSLSSIQYIFGDRESALETLQQAAVEWEDRVKGPKLFVEMRSECERGDRKVSEGHLHLALRLYTRVNDYQESLNYPLRLDFNWWRLETCLKRASVLIQLRRYKEAIHILETKVRWDFFLESDHKLEIERNELKMEAKSKQHSLTF